MRGSGLEPGRTRGLCWRGLAVLGLLLVGVAFPCGPLVAQTPTGKVLPLRSAGAHPTLHRAPAADAVAQDPARLEELLQLRWETQLKLRRELGPHGVSEKGRLRRQRRLDLIQKNLLAADEPETLRVLLVRIAFEEDRSGNLTSITTDGNFLLEPDSTVIFDPPPHDKKYFEAHLEGLSRYWSSMSRGRLVVEPTVLPPEDEDAYFLSDIADYGPGGNPDAGWTLERLVELVQDMIELTDRETQADRSVNLADYDDDDPNTYVIFAHAGGDLQSNLVWTPGQPDYSPNDIPTFFVQLGYDETEDDRVTLTSIDSETQQPGRMSECSVIPESTSQDGLLGSIAAAFYHEFGHALGLPDLYSTVTGLPTVGYWDLMDTGTNLAAAVQLEEGGEPYVVVGLLPPSISAWSKWYLGWTDPLRAGGRLQKQGIWASHQQEHDEAVLLMDSSSDEFFLAANRWVPAQGEPNWVLISDGETGVVQYLADDDGSDDPPNTHMYDFFIPWPGGLMVWQVRQDRIDATIATNEVQSLMSTRGLQLIEADGIQDLGVFEFTTRGFLGSENDAFRQGTIFPGILLDTDGDEVGDTPLEWPTTATEWTPTTLPGSDSSLRVPTGARIEAIGESESPQMFVWAGIDGLLDVGEGTDPVWPRWLPDGTLPDGDSAPLRGDPTSVTHVRFSGGRDALIVAAQVPDGTRPVEIFAYTPANRRAFPGYRDLVTLPAPLVGPPLVTEDFRDGEAALLLVTVEGTVRALTSEGIVAGAAEEWPGFPAAFDSVDCGPALLPGVDGAVLVAASLAESRVEWMDATGVAHPEWSDPLGIGESNELLSPPLVADLDGAGGYAVVVSTEAGLSAARPGEPGVAALFPEGYVEGFAPAEDERVWLVAWPDPDGGADRIVVATEGGRILRAGHDEDLGWRVEDFGRATLRPLLDGPALGDVDGDGRLDLVLVTDARLWVRNENGVDLTGFPLLIDDQHLTGEKTADGPRAAPLVVDLDDDGMNELLVLTRLGLLHAFEGDGRQVEGYPRKHSGPGATAPAVVDLPDPIGRRVLVLYESLGDSLQPGGVTRSARLNVIDLAPTPALPADERPAEWLALGGGMARTQRGASGAPGVDRSVIAAVAARSAWVWPNPIHGDEGRVHYYSGAEQLARLTVYTLEGEPVERFERPSAADVVGEVAFSTAGWAPGPYLCRIEYVGATGARSEILTVYVER